MIVRLPRWAKILKNLLFVRKFSTKVYAKTTGSKISNLIFKQNSVLKEKLNLYNQVVYLLIFQIYKYRMGINPLAITPKRRNNRRGRYLFADEQKEPIFFSFNHKEFNRFDSQIFKIGCKSNLIFNSFISWSFTIFYLDITLIYEVFCKAKTKVNLWKYLYKSMY